jgi:hypothetical protein
MKKTADLPIVRPSEESGMFKLSIHEFAPEDIVPNGDRYVVEQIEITDEVVLGQILVVLEATQQRGVQGRPWEQRMGEARGVFAAVVCSVGNGHLLGLPDWAVPIPGQSGWGSVRRESADVPMFFERGNLVLVDVNNKGRDLVILKRKVRIVNQMDVLASIPKVQLEWVGDQWQQVAAG